MNYDFALFLAFVIELEGMNVAILWPLELTAVGDRQ